MKYIIEISSNALKKEYEIELTKQLLFYQNASDKIIIERNKIKVERNIGVTPYGVPYILDETIEEIPISGGNNQVEFYEGDNTIKIKDYRGNIYLKYLYHNKLNSTYATKLELSSSIELLEQNINLRVWKKTELEELIAAINLIPGRIDMTGTITANNNTIIHTDGTLEAINGLFKGVIKVGEKILADERGVLTTMSFPNLAHDPYGNNVKTIGLLDNSSNGGIKYRKETLFKIYIPDNFTVTKAILYIDIPQMNINIYGNVHNPTLNKIVLNKAGKKGLDVVAYSEFADDRFFYENSTPTNALGENGIDIVASSNYTEEFKINPEFFSRGINVFTLFSNEEINANGDPDYNMKKQIYVEANIQVWGYIK